MVLAGAGGASQRLQEAAAAGCFGCLAGAPAYGTAANGARVAVLGDAATLAQEAYWAPPTFAWIEMLDSDAEELAAVARRAAPWDFFCSFGVLASADRRADRRAGGAPSSQRRPRRAV